MGGKRNGERKVEGWREVKGEGRTEKGKWKDGGGRENGLEEGKREVQEMEGN